MPRSVKLDEVKAVEKYNNLIRKIMSLQDILNTKEQAKQHLSNVPQQRTLKAIKTTNKELIPYQYVVRIRQLGSEFCFYDYLGKLHTCSASEVDHFINFLNK